MRDVRYSIPFKSAILRLLISNIVTSLISSFDSILSPSKSYSYTQFLKFSSGKLVALISISLTPDITATSSCTSTCGADSSDCSSTSTSVTSSILLASLCIGFKNTIVAIAKTIPFLYMFFFLFIKPSSIFPFIT